MQRLLFLTERFPPDIGGLATSAGRIAQALCQLGLAVDVVTWSRYLQPGEVLPPEPATDAKLPAVHRVGLYRHWDMTLPQTLNLLDWLHQIHPYDAIWGHYLFPAGFLATWFARLQGIASLVSIRGNDLDRALFPPGDFARLQWTLQNASVVTAVSQDMARKAQLVGGKEAIALYNAVDTNLFAPSMDATDLQTLRTQLGIAADELVLGFSGELREKKGQQFLLRSLTTVQTQRPACLLIIGEVRPSEQGMLQTFAVQHPEAAQRIVITGHLASPDQVAQHLQLCDVYLQPSLWEGMPNALLEAMACGICCIASDAGGIPEVIQSGINGFLLPRSQLHRLGEAVLECLALPQTERQQIGKAAQERVRSHFSLAQEKHQLEQILQLLKTG